MSAIEERLAKFITTRDRRVAKKWSPTPISEIFNELLARGVVRVGGRATCGTSVDPTWVEFCAWKEVVVKARKMGYQITETPIKHGNGWATKCGGFWEENEYRIERAA